MKKMIYIAGPYSSEDESTKLENTIDAIDAGIAVYQRGFIPLIPHLTHFVDQRARELGIDVSGWDYYEWTKEYLIRCDGLLYLKSSPGADKEMWIATRRGMRTFDSIEKIR
jgi:hypothetical protein